MLTIEKIKKDFSYIKAWTGNSETYYDSPIFKMLQLLVKLLRLTHHNSLISDLTHKMEPIILLIQSQMVWCISKELNLVGGEHSYGGLNTKASQNVANPMQINTNGQTTGTNFQQGTTR